MAVPVEWIAIKVISYFRRMKTFLALILVVLAIAEDISNDVTTVAPTSKPTEIPSDITGGCSTCTGSE